MRAEHAAHWLSAGLRWVVVTAAGCAAGVGDWQIIFALARPTLTGPLGAIAGIFAFGALLGVCVGLAQALALRLRALGGGIGRPGWWVLASGAGCTAGLLLATWVSGQMALALSGRVSVYLSDGSEDLAFGLLLGASIGLARWLVLRRRQPAGATRWIWASAVALAVGWSATLGIFDVLPGFAQPWLGFAFGACAGALVGLVEWLSRAASAV